MGYLDNIVARASVMMISVVVIRLLRRRKLKRRAAPLLFDVIVEMLVTQVAGTLDLERKLVM